MIQGRKSTAGRDKPLEFSKMAGGGNDFVVIDHRSGEIDDPSEFARRICTGHLSVGADGLILIERSARATVKMRYFNADGSLADFCANGTRCAARFAYLNVIAPKSMTIETGAGVIAAEIEGEKVALSLPPPKDFVASRPLEVSGGRTIRGSSIRVGVPHYVIFLRYRIWEHDIAPLGREIRTHADLRPEGANVNFVEVEGRNAINVRTYERGVEGETLACGSGVVASVAISALFGRVDSPVSVRVRSGIVLDVAFERSGDSIGRIRLTGDARLVFRSTLTPETVDGFDADWVRNPTAEALPR